MLNGSSVVGRKTWFQLTLVSIAVIVARAGMLGEPNASNELAETLVVRLPLNKVELKHKHTSGIMKWPAMSSESSKFSTASFFRSEIGTCDPERISLMAQTMPAWTYL